MILSRHINLGSSPDCHYDRWASTVIDKSVPLSSLHAGQSAMVSRITGQPDHVHRLEEFGLRGGTRFQMFRPGNPCILRMAAGKVCFRTDDLLRVFVELDALPSDGHEHASGNGRA